ncbi:MAG: sugar ABC transporter ATP-binding protein [Treponema sp.]|jgi:D-xylose transport system ATP-binding protein|nr:sugar ABC transporter ATP-binding protein [Treponema sp.]
MEYILEAKSITKKFPGVTANDNVNLNVRSGEILGLIGENGAGKSTLLKVLNGIYPYGSYTGTLVLDGKEIKPENTRDAMAEGIGYVPQETNVLKNFNVAENIYMSDLRLNRLKPADKRSKSAFVNFSVLYKTTEAFLKDNRINLDPKADVRKLSIGQQQMLMIARALATNPKVLILDEPTTSLSSGDVRRLFEVVRELRKKGVGIIFVTHKLSEILELTDRVTILRDGKNISTFEREQYDSGRIIADMIGREIKNMYPRRESKIGGEVLRVENLTVDHPYIADTNLIENVSFAVHEGEVVGLAGLVGAGRSEVCMSVYGLTPAKSGKIFIRGKEIKISKTSDAVKQKIGMISEDRKRFGLNFVWDIKHNIAISNLDTLVKGPFVSSQEMQKKVTPYYDKLRIKAPSLNTKVTTLSGGNQQKVVIARSLNTLPELIILDEPTKGIDVGSKNEIYQLINDLASQNVAVIMISSELPELMAMCDRFVVMAEGRVAGELTKSEATEAKIMEKSVVSFKTGRQEANNG